MKGTEEDWRIVGVRSGQGIYLSLNPASLCFWQWLNSSMTKVPLSSFQLHPGSANGFLMLHHPCNTPLIRLSLLWLLLPTGTLTDSWEGQRLISSVQLTPEFTQLTKGYTERVMEPVLKSKFRLYERSGEIIILEVQGRENIKKEGRVSDERVQGERRTDKCPLDTLF